MKLVYNHRKFVFCDIYLPQSTTKELKRVITDFLFLLHPLPKYQSITFLEFAKVIRNTYDIKNPKVKYAVEILENNHGADLCNQRQQ